MTKLIAIIIIVWGFFNPSLASWLFIVFFAGLESILALMNAGAKDLHSERLNDRQNELLREYSFLVRYPMTSRGLSSTLSLIQLSAIIWVPLLVWKGEYLQTIIIALNYFPAGLLSKKLNPQHFLNQEANKHDGIKSAQAGWLRDEITEVLELIWTPPDQVADHHDKRKTKKAASKSAK